MKRRVGRPQKPLPLISQKPGPFFQVRAFCDFLNATTPEDRVRFLYRTHLGVTAHFMAQNILKSKGKKTQRNTDENTGEVTLRPPAAWFYRHVPDESLEGYFLEDMWNGADYKGKMLDWAKANFLPARKRQLHRHLTTRQREFQDLFDKIIENKNPHIVSRMFEEWISEVSILMFEKEINGFINKSGFQRGKGEIGFVPILMELKELLLTKGAIGIGKCARRACNRYMVKFRTDVKAYCCPACSRHEKKPSQLKKT
ncbi:MAG: hypothetical protein KJ970_18165 [Candidatus Eisenbacteria bacterium]|uniref:Uncharacterized protein n=1 Tax=Eiseniibacteriota bacterium TaxID=2212470 RepID=A0A948S045_UNCEI|nr:hypothetical protein [Candidatus Eisenbacteria bacterium]MBU1948904.1 hypothetical protein [Candidatus Eisenbacteria bacterium]MBU2692848.1 hypothetical protein [Candidatus Eisenbacteria bacterium]